MADQQQHIPQASTDHQNQLHVQQQLQVCVLLIKSKK